MRSVAVVFVIVALGLVGACGLVTPITPTAAGASVRTSFRTDDVPPCDHGRQPKPGERCTGPVEDTSGGGGGALTIVVSVLVGLVIAGIAFVVLRRQLARPPGPPRRANPDVPPPPDVPPSPDPAPGAHG